MPAANTGFLAMLAEVLILIDISLISSHHSIDNGINFYL